MKSCSENVDNCIVIKRILTALSYYNHLDTDNVNDRSIFMNFMDTIYKHQVYDDKFHLIKFHQDDIESVIKLATTSYSCKSCDLSICSYSDRHFRVKQQLVNNKATTNTDDEMKYFHVYTEIMDSLHFYVFHLIDGGLRDGVAKMDTNRDEIKQNDSPYYDGSFLRLRDNISKTKAKTDRFTRLGGNKYNISTVNDSNEDNDQTESVTSQKKKKKGERTYLDSLYKHISSISTDNKQVILKLKKLIKSHDYDTESLDMDLNIFKEYGICNISLELNESEGIIPEMIKFLNKAKSLVIYLYRRINRCSFTILYIVGTFSVGFPFKYGGKKKGKYQVKPIYKDLKEEILNYKHIVNSEYFDITDKAEQYLQTVIVRKMKSRLLDRSMGINDLICIIMYCDYTELSREFTLSFRKLNPFESVQKIKKRNAVYYHWSKGLKDVMKHYGQHYNPGGTNGLLPKLKGPFYCGMSVVLKIPQFRMFIHSPISTSLQIMVATKFAGISFIISLFLQLYHIHNILRR